MDNEETRAQQRLVKNKGFSKNFFWSTFYTFCILLKISNKEVFSSENNYCQK